MGEMFNMPLRNSMNVPLWNIKHNHLVYITLNQIIIIIIIYIFMASQHPSIPSASKLQDPNKLIDNAIMTLIWVYLFLGSLILAM